MFGLFLSEKIYKYIIGNDSILNKKVSYIILDTLLKGTILGTTFIVILFFFNIISIRNILISAICSLIGGVVSAIFSYRVLQNK